MSARGGFNGPGPHRCGARRVHLKVTVEVQFCLAAARREVTLDLRPVTSGVLPGFNPAEMAGGWPAPGNIGRPVHVYSGREPSHCRTTNRGDPPWLT